jgi:hypothetical protein
MIIISKYIKRFSTSSLLTAKKSVAYFKVTIQQLDKEKIDNQMIKCFDDLLMVLLSDYTRIN